MLSSCRSPTRAMEAPRHEQCCVLFEVKGKAIWILNVDAARHHGENRNGGPKQRLHGPSFKEREVAISQLALPAADKETNHGIMATPRPPARSLWARAFLNAVVTEVDGGWVGKVWGANLTLKGCCVCSKHPVSLLHRNHRET